MNLAALIALTCFLLWIVLAAYLVWTWLRVTPYYPSSLKRLDRLYTSGVVPFKPNSRFIDLGSGDGKVVAWAHAKGLNAHGLEINPFISLASRLRLLTLRNSGLKIFNKNVVHHDYSNYDIVYTFLFNDQMERLREKLFTELPNGSVIIFNTFQFPKLEPDVTFENFNIYFIRK